MRADWFTDAVYASALPPAVKEAAGWGGAGRAFGGRTFAAPVFGRLFGRTAAPAAEQAAAGAAARIVPVAKGTAAAAGTAARPGALAALGQQFRPGNVASQFSRQLGLGGLGTAARGELTSQLRSGGRIGEELVRQFGLGSPAMAALAPGIATRRMAAQLALRPPVPALQGIKWQAGEAGPPGLRSLVPSRMPHEPGGTVERAVPGEQLGGVRIGGRTQAYAESPSGTATVLPILYRPRPAPVPAPAASMTTHVTPAQAASGTPAAAKTPTPAQAASGTMTTSRSRGMSMAPAQGEQPAAPGQPPAGTPLTQEAFMKGIESIRPETGFMAGVKGMLPWMALSYGPQMLSGLYRGFVKPDEEEGRAQEAQGPRYSHGVSPYASPVAESERYRYWPKGAADVSKALEKSAKRTWRSKSFRKFTLLHRFPGKTRMSAMRRKTVARSMPFAAKSAFYCGLAKRCAELGLDRDDGRAVVEALQKLAFDGENPRPEEEEIDPLYTYAPAVGAAGAGLLAGAGTGGGLLASGVGGTMVGGMALSPFERFAEGVRRSHATEGWGKNWPLLYSTGQGFKNMVTGEYGSDPYGSAPASAGKAGKGGVGTDPMALDKAIGTLKDPEVYKRMIREEKEKFGPMNAERLKGFLNLAYEQARVGGEVSPGEAAASATTGMIPGIRGLDRAQKSKILRRLHPELDAVKTLPAFQTPGIGAAPGVGTAPGVSRPSGAVGPQGTAAAPMPGSPAAARRPMSGQKSTRDQVSLIRQEAATRQAPAAPKAPAPTGSPSAAAAPASTGAAPRPWSARGGFEGAEGTRYGMAQSGGEYVPLSGGANTEPGQTYGGAGSFDIDRRRGSIGLPVAARQAMQSFRQPPSGAYAAPEGAVYGRGSAMGGPERFSFDPSERLVGTALSALTGAGGGQPAPAAQGVPAVAAPPVPSRMARRIEDVGGGDEPSGASARLRAGSVATSVPQGAVAPSFGDVASSVGKPGFSKHITGQVQPTPSRPLPGAPQLPPPNPGGLEAIRRSRELLSAPIPPTGYATR